MSTHMVRHTTWKSTVLDRSLGENIAVERVDNAQYDCSRHRLELRLGLTPLLDTSLVAMELVLSKYSNR